jgi:hypothetical protein
VPIEIRANDRGQLPNMPAPELIEHKAIRAAVESWHRAQMVARASGDEAFRLERGRSAAVALDAVVLADAMQGNKPDPGQVHTDAADVLIADAQRKAVASKIVAGRLLDTLKVTVEEHQAEWLTLAQKRDAAAGARWAEVLKAVTVAAANLAEARAVATYVAHGRYKPAAGGQVPLPRGGGSTASVESLVFALGTLGDPRGARPLAVGGLRAVEMGRDVA